MKAVRKILIFFLTISAFVICGMTFSYFHVPTAWRSRGIEHSSRTETRALLGKPIWGDDIKSFDVWKISVKLGNVEIFPTFLIVFYEHEPGSRGFAFLG